MNPSDWSPETRETWSKLESFPLDRADAVLRFSDRLARENGWSRAFALRAMDEYRRFLLLAGHAGHPVTPSEIIDQVWHLHLVYTRSYWNDLCQGVLGRPLHHEPTRGGLDDGGKHRDQYAQTLSSYRRFFGGEAPGEIWPRGGETSRPARHRWVDTSRHWLIPRWRMPVGFRPRLAVMAAAVSLLALAVAGCSGWNVFDYPGPEFVIFFAVALLVAIVLSFVLTALARWAWDRPVSGEPLTDPYEIAYLGGGGRRLVDAVLTTLFSRGQLTLGETREKKAVIGASVNDDPDWHPAERQVRSALPETGQALVRDVREALVPMAVAYQESLAERGYLFSRVRRFWFKTVAALPFVILMSIGGLKLFVGVKLDKAIFFLAVMLFVTLVMTGIRISLINKRTRSGQREWDDLWRRLRGERKSGDFGAGVANAAWIVALAGSPALKALGYDDLHHAIHRSGHGSGGGGCGSGDCSGSGCGGGCGGGGCGGCGGD